MKNTIITTLFLANFLLVFGQMTPKKPSQLVYDYNRKEPVSVILSGNLIDWNDTVVFKEVLELDLSNTHFNSLDLEIVGRTFPNLEVLNLSNNSIFLFDDGFRNFPKLRSLNLSNNKLVSLPLTAVHLEKLEVLDISSNDLEFYPENFKIFRSLKELSIHNNPKLNVNKVIEGFYNYSNLNKLSIDAPEIREEGLNFGETSITDLTIWNATTAHLNSFEGFDNIEVLGLENFKPTTAQLNGNFKSITRLELGNSPFPGSSKVFKSLTSLLLKGDFDQDKLSEFEQLDSLELINSGISQVSLSVIQSKLKNTQIIADASFTSPDFQQNTVSPIIEPKSYSEVVKTSEASVVKVEDLVFAIPQNAFRKEDGTLFQGNVNFSVTPIMDPVVMALSGSPMYAESEGQKGIFSSAGMFEVKAEVVETGEKLIPNQESIIQVEIPNNQPNSKSNLYYFDPVSKQWVLQSNMPSPSQGQERFIDSVMQIPLNENILIRGLITNTYMGKISKSETRLDKIGFRVEEKKSILANSEEKFLTSKSWILDTILGPKEDSVFYRQMYGWEEPNGFRKTIHRQLPIYYVKLTPDYEHDNYRFNYSYEGKEFEYPVKIPYGGDHTMAKQFKEIKKMEAKRQNLHKKDSLANIKSDSLINNQLREALKNYYLSNVQIVPNSFLQQQNEKMSFGLTSFGLVNCDFFMRNVPQSMFALGNELIDQNGNKYETPNILRIVLPEFSTYTEVDKNNIPIYNTKRTIGIIVLSAFELGIFHLGEKNKDPKKIKTFSIKGLTQDEVRDQIMQE